MLRFPSNTLKSLLFCSAFFALIPQAWAAKGRFQRAWDHIQLYQKAGCGNVVAWQFLTLNGQRTLSQRITGKRGNFTDHTQELVRRLALTNLRNYLRSQAELAIDAGQFDKAEVLAKQMDALKIDIGEPLDLVNTMSRLAQAQGVAHEIHWVPERHLSLDEAKRFIVQADFRPVIRYLPNEKGPRLSRIMAELAEWDIWGIFDPQQTMSSQNSTAAFVPHSRAIVLPNVGILNGLVSNEAFYHEFAGHALVDVLMRLGVNSPWLGHSVGNLTLEKEEKTQGYGKFQSHDEARAQLLSVKFSAESLLHYLSRTEQPIEDLGGNTVGPVLAREAQGFHEVVLMQHLDNLANAFVRYGRDTDENPLPEGVYLDWLEFSMAKTIETALNEVKRTLRLTKLDFEAAIRETEEDRNIIFYMNDGIVYAEIPYHSQHESTVPLIGLRKVGVFTKERADDLVALRRFLSEKVKHFEKLNGAVASLTARLKRVYQTKNVGDQQNILKQMVSDIERWTEIERNRNRPDAVAWRGRYRQSLIARSDTTDARDKFLSAFALHQPPDLYETMKAEMEQVLGPAPSEEVATMILQTMVSNEVDGFVTRLLGVSNWRRLSSAETFRIPIANTPSQHSMIAKILRNKGLLAAPKK